MPIAAVISLGAFLCGCGQDAGRAEKTYPPSAVVEVGKLSYTVSHPRWASSLEGERGPRIPKHQFLVLTISVTSKHTDQASVPLTTILDSSGQSYLELDNGEGVANWLGLFRNVEANGSDGGSIVFDLPPGKGPYKLRVSSGGDVDKEITALIEVPDEKASPSGALPSPDAGK